MNIKIRGNQPLRKFLLGYIPVRSFITKLAQEIPRFLKPITF